MRLANKRPMLVILSALILLASNFITLGQSEPSGIMALAAAGNHYAAAYFGRTIRIWHASTQEILSTIVYTDQLDNLDQVVYQIVDLEFSPNGGLLAASFGGGDIAQGIIRVFDATIGILVTELDAWSSAGDIAWSPDGSRLAARASYGAYTRFTKHIMVWDIPSGELVIDQNLGENASDANISWSPDGSKLATADGATLYLSNTTTWSREPIIVFPTGVSDITWSPNGSQIAGVDGQGTVYIADPSTKQIIRTLPGTGTGEYHRKLAWSENNQIAVTTTDQVLIWDAVTGNLLSTVPVPDAGAVAWLPGGRLLYAGSDTLTAPGSVILPSATPSPSPTATPLVTPTPSGCTFAIASGDVAGLTAAIDAANGSSGPDTICLAANSTYLLTAAHNTAHGANGLPAITSEITLLGNGAQITRDAAAPRFRIFYIGEDGALTLDGVTVSGGNAGDQFDGGGIRNYGTLTVIDSTITNNAVEGDRNGGGIITFGTATFIRSAISNNTAYYGGGIAIVGGSVTLSDVRLEGNTAGYSGGALQVFDVGVPYGPSHVQINGGSVITRNDGGVYGGGIAHAYNAAGSLTIADSTISQNVASTGAGLDQTQAVTTISASTISGNQANDGGGVHTHGGSLTLSAVRVESNTATDSGGGLRVLGTVEVRDGSEIRNNSAQSGGGIRNSGTLTLASSTLTGNTASRDGGGAYNVGTLHVNGSVLSDNIATRDGGGIYNWNNSTVSVQLGSSLTGNRADSSGGGLWNAGTATVSGTTLTGNMAQVAGGGIRNTGSLTVSGSTITGNSALGDGGGIHNSLNLMQVTDSLLTNNAAIANGGAIFNDHRDSSVRTSCISGNVGAAGGGVYSVTSRMDATNNWWGAASGPSGAGPGSGDAVNNRVLFTPFLTTGCPVSAGASESAAQSQPVSAGGLSAMGEAIPAPSSDEQAVLAPVIR